MPRRRAIGSTSPTGIPPWPRCPRRGRRRRTRSPAPRETTPDARFGDRSGGAGPPPRGATPLGAAAGRERPTRSETPRRRERHGERATGREVAAGRNESVAGDSARASSTASDLTTPLRSTFAPGRSRRGARARHLARRRRGRRRSRLGCECREVGRVAGRFQRRPKRRLDEPLGLLRRADRDPQGVCEQRRHQDPSPRCRVDPVQLDFRDEPAEDRARARRTTPRSRGARPAFPRRRRSRTPSPRIDGRS